LSFRQYTALVKTCKESESSSTTNGAAVRMSYTVVRKQFHAVVVAVFLPGLLANVNMLRVAVSCALVVLVMLEAGFDQMFTAAKLLYH